MPKVKEFGWRKRWFTGSLVLTHTYLWGFCGSRVLMSFPLDKKDILKEISFSLESDNTLCIKTEAQVFNKEASGTIEYRYTSEKASLFLKQLLDIKSKLL